MPPVPPVPPRGRPAGAGAWPPNRGLRRRRCRGRGGCQPARPPEPPPNPPGRRPPPAAETADRRRRPRDRPTGCDPVCGVAAVSSAYASGPASATTSRESGDDRAPRARRSACAISRPTAPATSRRRARRPAATGCQLRAAVEQDGTTTRPSRRAAPARGTPAASHDARSRHSVTAPMPTSAPIAGARATV